MESNTNVDKDKKVKSSEEKSVSDLCSCYVIDYCSYKTQPVETSTAAFAAEI